MTFLALAGLTLALSSCSCSSEAVQQQWPSLESDLASDPGDADLLLDFGTVLVGETAIRRSRLENRGNAALVVQIDRPRLPFTADLSRALSSIDVGGGADLRFSFSPLGEQEEPFEEVIEIATNEVAGGKTHRLRLRGRGVEAALRCEPEALHFGAVLLGSTTSLRATCTNPLPLDLEASLHLRPGTHSTHFIAAMEGVVSGSARIGAGESVVIDVDLRAQSLGANAATLELRDHLQQPIGSLPLLADVVASKLVVQPASCLDFSYVNLGSRSTGELTLVNVGSEDLRVSRIDVPVEEAEEFSVLTETPLHLQAGGGSAEVEIVFHPQRAGSREINLQIRTDDGERPIAACVKGFGGGPALACSPASRDLGPVGVGLPATARFTCSNVGAAPEGSVIDPLVVRRVSSDNELFTPTIRNPDGTNGPLSRGYRVGESFLLEVSYDPIAEVFEEAVVQVQTNVDRVELQVAGEGRDVEPCDFTINPPWLRFGIVPPGELRTQTLRIQNHGDSACIVHDLRLAEGTSPAFSMDALAAVEIQPDESLRVPVSFAPRQQGSSFTGKLLFEISHPTARYQEVELSGAARNPCLLVEPRDLDFGAVAPGCKPTQRQVKVSNVCGTPLEIASFDLGDGPDKEDFSIIRRPGTPLHLEPQGYAELVVAFNPLELGAQRGTLVVELEANPAAADNVYVSNLQGEGSLIGRQTDTFPPPGRPQMDILWVIDNSTSMRPYQETLQENLPAFLSMATSQDVDFHIGVTTSALVNGGDGCPGGANGNEDGRLFPIDGSHPRILTSSTPDLETHWRHNMAVGTCFDLWAESPLEAAYRALSPPLIYSETDIRHSSGFKDGNAGFLRPDAFLSVILVSDAKDFSPKPSGAYIDFFRGLKRGQADLLRVHAISGPRSNQTDSQCSVQPADLMLDVVEATGGTWLNICSPTSDTMGWTEALEKMSTGVFALARRQVLRGVPADANGDGKVDELDIELRVDGRVEPPTRERTRVWTYDPLTNSVGFEPLFHQRPETLITATYDLSCH